MKLTGRKSTNIIDIRHLGPARLYDPSPATRRQKNRIKTRKSPIDKDGKRIEEKPRNTRGSRKARSKAKVYTGRINRTRIRVPNEIYRPDE